MASEHIPGLEDLEVVTNLQMFTQVWRSRISPNVQMTSLNKHFHRLLQVIFHIQSVLREKGKYTDRRESL